MTTHSMRNISAAMLACAALLVGCTINTNLPLNGDRVVGSGISKTESRPVVGISSVASYGSGELIVERGDTESLTITADDNILPYLTSDVSNGKLTLSTKPNTSISTRKGIVYRLTVKKLNSVETYGSGSIKVTGVAADSFQVVSSGSGSVEASGKATRQNVSLNGSGGYKADNLECQQAVIKSNGSGSALVRVSDTLAVELNGSGSVDYIGQPSLDIKSFGSGKVTPH